jgi:hypothetical protein
MIVQAQCPRRRLSCSCGPICTTYSSVPAADGNAAVALAHAELLLKTLGARAAGVAAGRVEAGRGRRPRLRATCINAHGRTNMTHTCEPSEVLLKGKLCVWEATLASKSLVSHSSTSTQTLAPSAPNCPGRKMLFFAVNRLAGPYKSPVQNGFI